MRFIRRILTVLDRFPHVGMNAGVFPRVLSASVPDGDTAVTIVFSVPMTGQTGFAGVSPTRTLTYASGEGTATYVFTASSPLTADQTPGLVYTGSAMRSGGLLLQPFIGFSIDVTV